MADADRPRTRAAGRFELRAADHAHDQLRHGSEHRKGASQGLGSWSQRLVVQGPGRDVQGRFVRAQDQVDQRHHREPQDHPGHGPVQS